MNPTVASDRTITAGVLWSMLDGLARQGLTFAVFVILARLMGPESYGLVGMALAVSMALQALGSLGLSEPLIRRKTDDLDHDSAHWTAIGAGALFAGLISLVSPWIARALGHPEIAVLIAVLSLVLPLNAASVVPGALLRKQMRFGLFAVRTPLGVVLGAAVGVALALNDGGVWSLVAFQLLRAFVSSTFLWFAGSWRPRLRYSLKRSLSLMREGVKILGQISAGQVAEEVPKLILGAALGPATVGIYLVCRRMLDSATEALIAPFMSVSIAALAGARGDPERLNAIYSRFLTTACLLGFPAFAGLAALAPDLLLLLYGPSWTSGAVAMAFFMAIGCERLVNVFSATSLNAIGKPGVLLRFVLGISAASLLATFLAAPHGLTMVAAAQTGVVVCGLPILLWATARHSGLNVAGPLRMVFFLALCAAAMGFGVRELLDLAFREASTLKRVGIGMGTGIALYALLVVLFARGALASTWGLLKDSTRREPPVDPDHNQARAAP